MRLVSFAVLLALVASASACKDKNSGAANRVEGNVPVTVDQDGFKPSSVTFKKGAAAALVFTRTTDQTCATEVVFPELKITKELPKGTPVAVSIPTDKEQSLTFQCGMGMYKSSVVIASK